MLYLRGRRAPHEGRALKNWESDRDDPPTLLRTRCDGNLRRRVRVRLLEKNLESTRILEVRINETVDLVCCDYVRYDRHRSWFVAVAEDVQAVSLTSFEIDLEKIASGSAPLLPLLPTQR